MTNIDVVLVILLLVAMFYGGYKGFLQVFFYLLALILGFFLASKLRVSYVDLIPQNLMGIILIFLGTFLIIKIFTMTFNMLIGKFLDKKPVLKVLNKVAGVIFAGLLMFLIIGLTYQSTAQETKISSKFFKVVTKFGKKVYNVLPPKYQEKMSNMALEQSTRV